MPTYLLYLSPVVNLLIILPLPKKLIEAISTVLNVMRFLFDEQRTYKLYQL